MEMDEKRTIIDELWTQARIYLDEQVEIVIKTIQHYDYVPDSCLKCGASLEEIYARPEEVTKGWNDYDLIVLKCEKCNLFYAFWLQPSTYDETFLTPTKEDEHRGGRRMEPPKWEYVCKPEWGEGKQPKFSKEFGKTYERTKLQLEDLNTKLNNIITPKLAQMYRAGISTGTINSAREKVRGYLWTNSATSKQLVSLLAAAIYETSHEGIYFGGSRRVVGEKISERKLEKIFGVTRKTIRNWRKRLHTSFTHFPLVMG